MKVYGHPMSTCTRKVLTTLAEKGHEAEFVLVDLMKGEQKLPAHLARQPFGVVPAFEADDGTLLYESRAIIRYLDRVLSGGSLTPSQSKSYGLMEQFIGVEQSYFSPAAMKIVMVELFHRGEGSEAAARVADGRQGVEKAFSVIEPVLGRQQFLAGDAFSLADVTWMPYLGYLGATSAKDLVGKYPNVSAWWNRISARPSWRKVAG
ncbi:glutathione S-transferase family protein [Myxococcus landrumensis]|uniref:glutathione transferase n=1 Tax=Myxococcus landrumensis TaxID=2813577 RepID=A0ABX7NHA5_9BACT|nr:glutathione binding-like protein [Myxococcus landrumus]QSQ18003.1 glutathione S-transferase N-terminal domain-containing protein [Myxococcus landrumus]